MCPRVCGPSGGRAGDHQVRPRRGSGRRLADARRPRRPLAALSLLPGPAAGPVCACVCAHTAEAPPDPPATAATVVELAGVVVELGPEARINPVSEAGGGLEQGCGPSLALSKLYRSRLQPSCMCNLNTCHFIFI